MKIQMNECEASSNIHSHGHDPERNVLAICFRSGGGAGSTYHYQNVTSAMYEEFKKAESLGKHFHTTIRGNDKYPGSKQ